MRGLVVAVLCLAGCDRVFGLDRPGEGIATLAGFDYRKQIRIVSSASEPLMQFPVALILDDDPDLKAGVNTGRDFAVTAGDGQMTLSIELERWDPEGDLLLWVRIPEMAPDGETIVYLYYGGEPQPVEQSTTWNDLYGAVWHLAGTAVREDDSTTNDQRLTADSSNPGSEPGLLGNARKLNGGSDRFLTPSSEAIEGGAESFSSSMWINVKASHGTSDMALFMGGASATIPGYDYELGSGGWQAQVADGTTKIVLGLGTDALEREWRHLAAVVDRGADVARGYLDGQLVTELPLNGLGSISTTATGRAAEPLRVGSVVTPLEGTIDEVRLYHGAWSSAWLATEYRNVTAPTEFLLVSDAESIR